MIFRRQKGIFSVQVERIAKLTLLTRYLNKAAGETKEALIRTADSVPDVYMKSIIFDNGTEGAKHMELKEMFGIET